MFRALYALFLLLLLLPCYGQSISELADTPTIFANTNEVSQDIVVHDRKNKPILDLKPEEFTLIDNGTAVKISSLRLVTEKSDVPRSITLVFNQMTPSAATNASQIANKILKIVPESGFSLSVMNVSGRLRLFQGFTEDRTALRKAINLATGEITSQNLEDAALPEKQLMKIAETGKDLVGKDVSSQEQARAQIMLMTLQEAQRIVQDQHGQPALAGLLALSRTQRKIAGRKAVVLFVEGLQVSADEEELLHSIISSANRSDVSIYIIDANSQDSGAAGLVASNAISGAVLARAMAPSGISRPPGLRNPSDTVGSQLSRLQMDGTSAHEDPLTAIAENTGGLYVAPGQGLKKPLEQLLEDMTNYYEASYVPPLEEYNGRFRSVVVKCSRTDSLIRSRTGYFALPPDSESGVRPFETPLLKLLAAKQPPSALMFHADILRLGELPDGNANALVVEVPLRELKIEGDAGQNTYSMHLSIVAQIKALDGSIVEHFSEDLPRHGSKKDMEDAAGSEFATMQRHFVAAPGKYILEAAIEDRISGKASVQRVNFEIPSIPAGPSLSDVSLVRKTDQFTWEADPLDPLRYENSRVIPNLSGAVTRAAQIISFFFIIHPDPLVSAQAKLEMAIIKNGKAVAHLPLALRKSSGKGALPYLASIRATALPPGDYEVQEILTQGGKSTSNGIAFRINAQ
jgi:VWFA-related protein